MTKKKESMLQSKPSKPRPLLSPSPSSISQVLYTPWEWLTDGVTPPGCSSKSDASFRPQPPTVSQMYLCFLLPFLKWIFRWSKVKEHLCRYLMCICGYMMSPQGSKLKTGWAGFFQTDERSRLFELVYIHTHVPPNLLRIEHLKLWTAIPV